ncbi:MAG: hypothetical protein K5978_01300 [Campylobacter sp.]|nr:hypothetical protein [Campylobacter sp.]
MDLLDEKAKRVRYIRALEKFAKSAINGLKRADFNEDEFRLRIQKNEKNLTKLEAVYLDNVYTKTLENFVNALLGNHEKSELLRMANLLLKLKNQKNYKKDKHKNKFKDEI